MYHFSNLTLPKGNSFPESSEVKYCEVLGLVDCALATRYMLRDMCITLEQKRLLQSHLLINYLFSSFSCLGCMLLQ